MMWRLKDSLLGLAVPHSEASLVAAFPVVTLGLADLHVLRWRCQKTLEFGPKRQLRGAAACWGLGAGLGSPAEVYVCLLPHGVLVVALAILPPRILVRFPAIDREGDHLVVIPVVPQHSACNDATYTHAQ